MSDLVLKVRGKSYAGWTGIDVSRSMENLSGTFSFSSSNKWPASPNKFMVRVGDDCKVMLDGNAIITGYVDDVQIVYSDSEHSIGVSGRDKVGDLVDCCFVGNEKQMGNRTSYQIIKDLCDPFGIRVVVDSTATSQVNKKHANRIVNFGDTIFDSISRLCRDGGFLAISNGDGDLILTKVTTSKMASDKIKIGNNALRGTFSHTWRERFSEYTVVGQGNSDDSMAIGEAGQAKAEFSDDVISRYRPLVVMIDESATKDICQDRAKWEARYRAAKSKVFSCIVQGWKQSNGKPWDINTLVQVRDPFIGMEVTLTISSVRFMLNDADGEISELAMVRKDAYDVLQTPISKNETQVFDISVLREKLTKR